MTELIAPIVYLITFLIGGVLLGRVMREQQAQQIEMLNLQIELALIELTLSELEK